MSHGAPTLANIECQEDQQRLTSTSTTRAVSAAGSTTSSSLLGAGKRGLPAAGAWQQWEPQPPSIAPKYARVAYEQAKRQGSTSMTVLPAMHAGSRGEPPPKIHMRPPQATAREKMHSGSTLQDRGGVYGTSCWKVRPYASQPTNRRHASLPAAKRAHNNAADAGR